MIRFLLLGSLFLFCPNVIASPDLQDLDTRAISKSETWLKLLVYNGEESFITSEKFFFAANGRHDPHAELLATLEAFAETQQIEQPDSHPQCRFPGRYLWLKTQLDLAALSISDADCPEYNTFIRKHDVNSISLIFATGFLGNPASYYGHLLIKLNSANSELSDLQNTAINFGADVPIDENMAVYIIKGITGGYDSAFTHQQYFLHAGNYGESELRDLWEYELDLDTADLALVLGHTYELLDSDYQYFFFHRNCAFHMAQLLQLVLEDELISTSRLWVTPQAIMQNLASSTYQAKPLIKTIKYHPSRQSRLYQRFALLNQQQKQALSSMVSSPEKLSLHQLTHFSLVQQQQVIDTLIDYFQFLRKADKGEADPNNRYYKQALMLRYQLPPGASSATFASEQRPHLGRKPSLTSLQYVSSNRIENFGKIQLRPAYYDALDAQQGHVAYSALSMAELNLGFTADEVFLKDMSLLKIESIRANLTGLPGDQNHSWYIDIGAAQSQLGCTTCAATKVSSGIGYAFQSSVNFNISGFVGAGYLGRNMAANNTYAATRLLSTWYITNRIAASVDAEYRHFQSGYHSHLVKFVARYGWSTNTELRFGVANDKVATEIGLSLGWYW